MQTEARRARIESTLHVMTEGSFSVVTTEQFVVCERIHQKQTAESIEAAQQVHSASAGDKIRRP